jgi:hypothetical protein
MFNKEVWTSIGEPFSKTVNSERTVPCGKIGVLKEAARLADDGTQLELGGLKMGIDPLAAGSIQGAEQPIAPRIVVSLSLGHSGILELLASLFVRPLQLRGCARLTTFLIDGKLHGISKNAWRQHRSPCATRRLSTLSRQPFECEQF